MTDYTEEGEMLPTTNPSHFKKGNQFWKARATHGKGKCFATPEILEQSCLEYFQWVEDNPLWEYKVSQYQGVPVPMQVPKMRAMTIGGLCLFLGCDRQTWINYRTLEAYSDYFEVVNAAEETIRDQKFTGAAADLLNANIIARDLGLSDKRELTGKDGESLGAMVKYEIVGGPGEEPPLDD